MFTASVVVLLASIAVVAGQRPNSEIAADLERIAAELMKLAAELKLPPAPTEILVRQGDNLQAALDGAAAGATVRLDDDATFRGSFTVTKPVKIVTRTGRLTAIGVMPALTVLADDVSVSGVAMDSDVGASTNDLVVIKGARTELVGVSITGNGATKRGIAANGRAMVFRDIQVRRIGRVGQESQAVAIWDGTGLTIRGSVLEAGSTPFLSGGAAPVVPNHVPADIVIEDSTLTHPLEWRGKGYVNKTGFEVKSGRRIIVRRTTIENVWVDGQTGYAITLTASQYGNSPETTVEDVLFDSNIIRNAGSGVNALGFTQHADRPTLRGHNFRFVNNTFTLSRALYGGHGSLMQLAREPADVVWTDNTVTQDGDAFLRTADAKPITGFLFQSNTVTVAGTYGVWTPVGSRGVGWATTFPGGQIITNTFTAAHATFKVNFPNNTWQ